MRSAFTPILVSAKRALCTPPESVAFDVTEATFDEKVLNSKNPVIVEFHASWCGPCRFLAPVLDEAVSATNGSVQLAKLDVDANGRLAAQHKVSSIPLVLGYHNGKIIDQFSGLHDPAYVSKFVNKLAALKE
eukprot:CFRG2816T1